MVDTVLLERSGAIASVTFNHPEKANSLDVRWFDPMIRFFNELESEPEIRVVLLKGNGKHFMAGGNLDQVEVFLGQTPAERAILAEGQIHPYNVMVRTMRRLGKPIVASVQGGVAGAAVGLVAACDLVIAAESAFFFVAHILHGGSNDGLTTFFLPRQIGIRKTLELALLGDRIKAAEAERLGLVNFVVPDAELGTETSRLVQRLAQGPTRAYGLIKNLIDASLDNTLETQGRLEAETYGRSAATSDWIEGIRAFKAKRPPQFLGK